VSGRLSPTADLRLFRSRLGAHLFVADGSRVYDLDPETAEALVADVFEAAGERSVLLITHRPEGLDLVDEVVSLAAR